MGGSLILRKFLISRFWFVLTQRLTWGKLLDHVCNVCNQLSQATSWSHMVPTACHFIKISQVKKHDCHWIPGWLGMLRNEELLIRKNLVGPFWRNLTCSDFTMEQNSWKWGKLFSFFAFWGIMMQFYKFLHIIWIFPQNNWNFLYFMLLSMKFVPKPSKSIRKCRILVPEIQFWLFEG